MDFVKVLSFFFYQGSQEKTKTTTQGDKILDMGPSLAPQHCMCSTKNDYYIRLYKHNRPLVLKNLTHVHTGQLVTTNIHFSKAGQTCYFMTFQHSNGKIQDFFVHPNSLLTMVIVPMLNYQRLNPPHFPR